MDIPLEALSNFSYDGRNVTRGQVFLARSESDAHILRLLQKARPARPTRQPWTPPPEHVSVGVDLADDPDKPKRRSRRRDVMADVE